jgi:hypothetical protein
MVMNIVCNIYYMVLISIQGFWLKYHFHRRGYEELDFVDYDTRNIKGRGNGSHTNPSLPKILSLLN